MTPVKRAMKHPPKCEIVFVPKTLYTEHMTPIP